MGYRMEPCGECVLWMSGVACRRAAMMMVTPSPGVPWHSSSMTWKDEDGDFVTITGTEDLQDAVKEVPPVRVCMCVHGF